MRGAFLCGDRAHLLAITLYVVPEIFKSLELIGETARVNIPVYADQIAKWADELSKQFDLDFSTMVDSLNNFNWSSILSGATEFTTNFFSSLVNVTVNVASGIFTFVLSVIFSAYFLTSKESLLLSLKRVSYSLLPKKVVATLADIAVTSNNVFSSFVRGQLTECVILGCLCFICMSLIGFDYALLISCIVTITALIPILGAYIGCGIGAFLLLIVNPMDAVWFVIFFICLQQFEGNLIYPRSWARPLVCRACGDDRRDDLQQFVRHFGHYSRHTDCSGSIHGDAPRDNEPPCGARAFKR